MTELIRTDRSKDRKQSNGRPTETVNNVYWAYNFSYFVIYLPKVIKIDGNLTKFWQKQFCTVFLDTVYIQNPKRASFSFLQ